MDMKNFFSLYGFPYGTGKSVDYIYKREWWELEYKGEL